MVIYMYLNVGRVLFPNLWEEIVLLPLGGGGGWALVGKFVHPWKQWNNKYSPYMVIFTHAEFQTNKMTYKTSVKKVGEISQGKSPLLWPYKTSLEIRWDHRSKYRWDHRSLLPQHFVIEHPCQKLFWSGQRCAMRPIKSNKQQTSRWFVANVWNMWKIREGVSQWWRLKPGILRLWCQQRPRTWKPFIYKWPRLSHKSLPCKNGWKSPFRSIWKLAGFRVPGR